jgi:hypothetical protein
MIPRRAIATIMMFAATGLLTEIFAIFMKNHLSSVENFRRVFRLISLITDSGF